MEKNDLLKLFSNTKSEFGKFVVEYLKEFDKLYHELEEVKKLPESINNLGTNPNLDLKTYEGYSQYMKNLGELRNMVNQRGEYFNNITKQITGKTATEILDSVAKEVTSYYIENQNQNKKEPNQKEQEQKCTCNEKEPNIKQCNCNTDGQKKYTINEADENEDDVYVFPSMKVDDETYSHICNIVDKYVDEEVSKYCDINGLEPDDSFDDVYNELIEFACWLSKAK